VTGSTISAAFSVTPSAAAGSCVLGGPVVAPSGSYSWIVNAGKISKSGWFTAPSKAKVVTVTVKNGSLKATAKVNVVVASQAGLAGLSYPSSLDQGKGQAFLLDFARPHPAQGDC
jgi:hypothetical protein